MFNFLTSRVCPIALDIGGDSIRMLQMRRSGSLVHVTASAKWRFPAEARASASARRAQTVTAVRRMLREGGFRGRKAVSCLSCQDLAIKSIRLPSLPPEELARAAYEEARERFPFEIDPDQLSFLHAGQIRQGNETREEMVLLAAPRDVIDDHLALLEEVGLRALHIDAEPLALFRTAERYLRRRSDEQAVTVVVDLGYRGTRVIVARGRQIVFLKNIEIGGRQFDDAVAKQLNVPVEEASELRSRAGRPPAETTAGASGEASSPGRDAVETVLRDAVRGETDLLAKEISLCLRYCSVTFRGVRPESITLTGGEAQEPAIVTLLGEHLNLPCKVAWPLRGIDVSAVDLRSDRRGNLADWALCAGLAMRGVDVPAVSREDDDGQRDRLSA